MTEDKLFEVALQAPLIPRIRERLDGGGFLCLHGVADAAKPLLLALLHRLRRGPTLVATAEPKFQEVLRRDLQSFHPLTCLFPAWETLPHEDVLPHADITADRLGALQAINQAADGSAESQPILVASVRSLMQRTLPLEQLDELCLRLARGQTIPPAALLEQLGALGYSFEYQVGERGDVARRGGIVDIYPIQADNPIRLEFFGDTIESIRLFDINSQKSIGQSDDVGIFPATEIGLTGQPQNDLVPLVDRLPSHTLLVLDEPERLDEVAGSYAERLPADHRLYAPWQRIKTAPLQQLTLQTGPALSSPAHAVALDMTSLDAFRPLDTVASEPAIAARMRQEFFLQIRRWQEDEGYQVHVLCSTDGELQRFQELWHEEAGADEQTMPLTEVRFLSRGLLWTDAKLVVVTDAEIYGRHKLIRVRHQYHRLSQPSDWSEFNEGDFVVHLQHGIGKFLGLRTITQRERVTTTDSLRVEERLTNHEVLTIEYADQARVYVPIDQAHLVNKYISAGKRTPPLHRLGSGLWQRQKQRAEKAILDLASELLEIQAARATLHGHAYSQDTEWQREFEAAFAYEETPDQEDAILAVKRDMETSKPMDRLICGDVGYGKTEVALRAAFKAVMEGFQVAVLVPTTILAEQHYQTFRERLAGYPVATEMLSRFRTAGQQRQIIDRLRRGEVDIVIGTHRLLSADVAFKNIGLVVIDEEQRFGVLHKERFKHLRKLIDVITLSATPIPRTLYLSLTGARDMSTIQTPPQDRLPVETTVAPYDEPMIQRVITRELDRGGQVFFLHNRVRTIESVATKLRRLLNEKDVPSSAEESDTAVRVEIAHGQMHEHQLEEVMQRFVNGQIDVLVCTTIIESGLDIPNANTIIIDRADRFGLSDLYQLRGRVGRYKHQAYAYMLIPPQLDLVANAKKRIGAIRRYSSLGSGFKIAMRDLEIRGAGNVLGPEQSGHISAIGFDLYCQLLKQSIARLKNEPVHHPPQVTVRLDFLATADKAGGRQGTVRGEAAAHIPTHYIAESRRRVEAYRRLAAAATLTELEAVEQELHDRYGSPPREITRLFHCARLKFQAATAGIEKVETRDGRLMLTRNGQLLQVDGKFPRLAATTIEDRLDEIIAILGSRV